MNKYIAALLRLNVFPLGCGDMRRCWAHLTGSTTSCSRGFGAKGPQQVRRSLHWRVPAAVEQHICVTCHHLTLFHRRHCAVIKQTPTWNSKRHTVRCFTSQLVKCYWARRAHTYQRRCAGCSYHWEDERRPCSVLRSFRHNGWSQRRGHRQGAAECHPYDQYRTYSGPNFWWEQKNLGETSNILPIQNYSAKLHSSYHP